MEKKKGTTGGNPKGYATEEKGGTYNYQPSGKHPSDGRACKAKPKGKRG